MHRMDFKSTILLIVFTIVSDKSFIEEQRFEAIMASLKSSWPHDVIMAVMMAS